MATHKHKGVRFNDTNSKQLLAPIYSTRTFLIQQLHNYKIFLSTHNVRTQHLNTNSVNSSAHCTPPQRQTQLPPTTVQSVPTITRVGGWFFSSHLAVPAQTNLQQSSPGSVCAIQFNDLRGSHWSVQLDSLVTCQQLLLLREIFCCCQILRVTENQPTLHRSICCQYLENFISTQSGPEYPCSTQN